MAHINKLIIIFLYATLLNPKIKLNSKKSQNDFLRRDCKYQDENQKTGVKKN